MTTTVLMVAAAVIAPVILVIGTVIAARVHGVPIHKLRDTDFT